MKRSGLDSGFTLIEVLVTFLVIALGLLGLAALQVNTINNAFEAYQRALVTALVDDMSDRLRMNPQAVSSGAYSPFNPDAVCISATTTTEMTATLTPGDRASHDQCQWSDLIDGLAVTAAAGDEKGIAAPIGAMGCIEMLTGSGSANPSHGCQSLGKVLLLRPRRLRPVVRTVSMIQKAIRTKHIVGWCIGILWRGK